MKPILLSMVLALVAVGLLAGIPQSADAGHQSPPSTCNAKWDSNHYVSKPEIDDDGKVTQSRDNYEEDDIFTTHGFWVKPHYVNGDKKKGWGDWRPGIETHIDPRQRVKACVSQANGTEKWFFLSPEARRIR